MKLNLFLTFGVIACSLIYLASRLETVDRSAISDSDAGVIANQLEASNERGGKRKLDGTPINGNDRASVPLPQEEVFSSVDLSQPRAVEATGVSWKERVENPSRLVIPREFSAHDEFDGVEMTDLSERKETGQYLLMIYDLFPEHNDKHERRERGRLVELLEETAAEHTRARAEVLGLEYEGTDEEGRSFLIVGFDQGEPVYSRTMNASAADSSAASYVRQNTSFDPVFGPDIDGRDFFFNVNDHGIARQHLEFQLPNSGGSRVIEREAEDNDGHMDHVTGTVGAHGYREDAKGMAPAVMMYSLNQQSDADVELLGARYPFEPRRSIGGTTSLGGSYEGRYTFSGSNFDQVLRETPYYLHFYAAGNGGGWNEVTSGRQVAKNMMTVGSGRHVSRDAQGNYLSGGNLSGFSSRGPADDGRIKPDIVANGEGVTSTSGTSGYSNKQGTSMATPNASGSSILLQDYFSKRFPGHLMQSMTLKNLILHTADDLGNTGPDYKYGWGFMNARKAADLIKAYADNPGNQRMTEAVIRNGDSHSYSFTWDGSSPLVANLAWLDYRGLSSFLDDDREPDLTYDLDLRVTSPSGNTTYLPWAMPFVLDGFDTNDYDADAVKADNTTDNVEQVRIDSPSEAGVYTVTVSHKGTIESSDAVHYSLILSGVDDAAGAAAPTISSFSPAQGTHDHTLVTLDGSGFLLGANVSLEAPGLETVEGYAEKVTPDQIEVFFPLDRVSAGSYQVVVTNPDGQGATSVDDFVVTAYTDLLDEDFDAPGFDFATAGWTTAADAGTNDWTLSSAVAVSGSSAHVPTRTEEVLAYLESPPASVPNTNAPIKLSFVHQWDFEIELPTSSFGAHEGEDGALLMVSVDGGAFKHVGQDFWDDAEAPGAEIVSGDYWDNLASENPIEYTAGTTYAWTDESGGWQRTTVMLDAATYQNKTLRFRWVLGTQNTGSDNNEGWWIDDVSLSVKDDNVLPQASTTPAAQAVEGQLYSEAVAFADADGDPVSLTATAKPAWLSFTDDGSGNGTLSGTPASGDVGTSTVTIEADDGTGLRSYTFSLVVLPVDGNNAPTFNTGALDSALVENLYTFTLTTSDADGHSLDILAGSLPAWLSFTDNGDGTATLSGTPNAYAVNTIDLDFSVSDGIDTTSANYILQVRPPAEIAFNSGSVSVGEGDGTVTVTVNRTLNAFGEVEVDYDTASGTATSGADFTSTSGTLTWANGDSEPKQITIQIVDDAVYNESESFAVTLSNPTNDSELGATDQVTVTIDDNDVDSAPAITLLSPATNSVVIPFGVGLFLDTTVSDSGPSPLSLSWSKVSGPGALTWDTSGQADTGVRFSDDGDYVLRLTAADDHNSATVEVSVSVGGGQPPAIDFAAATVEDGDGDGGSHEILDGGSTFRVTNNAWKGVAISHTVTADTVLSFDFKSSDIREIHAIGLVSAINDNDKNRMFQLAGSQNWGISDYKTYSGSGWVQYDIPVGQFYTGDVNYLYLTCDDDSDGFGESQIRNVRIHRQGAGAAFVDAGGAYTGIASVPLALDGTVTDPDGSTTNTTWSQVDGPGTAAFADATAIDTSVSTATAGAYSLRLSADNGSAITFDQADWTVNPSGPSVLVAESGASTDVAEGGVSDSYTLMLTEPPLDDVTVSISPDGQLSTDVGSALFTAANWDAPQTVTVAAVDDAMIEGTHSGVITHSVSSADVGYDGIAVDDTIATITDNDTNTTPQITLNSPAAEEVSIPSGVGMLIDTTATDDGVIAPLSLTWSQESGPGTASFSSPNAEDTRVQFDAGGSYQLRLTADDGASQATLDLTVTVGDTTGPGYRESGGMVVMEAESFDAQTSVGGQAWTVKTDKTGYVGEAFVTALPNDGTLNNTDYTAGGSPRLDYQVNFSTTGTYYVWIRGNSSSGNDDSVHASLNDQVISTADRISISSDGNWTWRNSTMDPENASLEVSSAGVHTFNLYMREDGASVDRIVLTTDSGYSPSGDGPAISAQGASQGPDVDPGGPYSVAGGTQLTLSATVTDDGAPEDPGALTLSWSQVSGSGTASFVDETVEDAVVNFDAAGTYTLRLAASDGMVTTFADVEVTVELNFGSWAANSGLAGADADPGADPDGDGVYNLIEYALNGDPSTKELSALVTLGQAANKPTLSFTLLDAAAVNIVAESSYDLNSWTPVAEYSATTGAWAESGASVSEMPAGDTTEVTITHDTDLTTEGRQFLQLRITE